MIAQLNNVFSIDKLRAHVDRGAKHSEVKHATKHCILIFLHLGEPYGDNQYLLALKTNLRVTHKCCGDASYFRVAFTFGVPKIWFSDQGSHFTIEVVDHVFSVAYCPWIHGSIERINRYIIQALRVLIMEYKVDHRDWVARVPIMQASLNNTPLPSLTNKSLLELFTRLPTPSLFAHALLQWDGGDIFVELPRSDAIERPLLQLRESVRRMHCEIMYYAHMWIKKVTGHLGVPVYDDRGPSQASGMTCTHHDLIVFADSDLEVSEELIEHVATQGMITEVKEIKENRFSPMRRNYA
ncbi:hypothetical protein PHMEG_00018192 [Phytophthora megakarya]|uniref:Integrase catalytic domain-containing protein n=1 Tax=Phytophthora megakarya TaxID=4795 RepID=A0A225VVG2_9STRA|nr:hypothetical protein PHMEG_00018192 [Phytophthora megakarya]